MKCYSTIPMLNVGQYWSKIVFGWQKIDSKAFHVADENKKIYT